MANVFFILVTFNIGMFTKMPVQIKTVMMQDTGRLIYNWLTQRTPYCLRGNECTFI